MNLLYRVVYRYLTISPNPNLFTFYTYIIPNILMYSMLSKLMSFYLVRPSTLTITSPRLLTKSLSNSEHFSLSILSSFCRVKKHNTSTRVLLLHRLHMNFCMWRIFRLHIQIQVLIHTKCFAVLKICRELYSIN